MIKIGFITTSRADYSLLRPVIRAAKNNADFDVILYVTGMHLISHFGNTQDAIESQNLNIKNIPCLLASDSPESVSKSMGLTCISFAQAFSESRPDILVVLGDRYEMFAAAQAAIPFGIPICHIHGGELTFGAMDDIFRHCLTKMANLHFAATTAYAKRVIQLGEEPWRVTTSGSPAIDNILSTSLPKREHFLDKFEISFSKTPLLVTMHPETNSSISYTNQIETLLTSLSGIEAPIIFTAPNADQAGQEFHNKISEFVAKSKTAMYIKSFGDPWYYAALQYSCAMVGNSSSGIIDAPSFRLPVVNIGNRQAGRVKGRNVIDVPFEQKAIVSAICLAMTENFKSSLKDETNPYGNGISADKIISKIKMEYQNKDLRKKRFHDNG